MSVALNFEMFELFARFKAGEILSKEEHDLLSNYSVRYDLVRILVMEKLNYNSKVETLNFHFTVGKDFMTIPITDMVNSIVRLFDQMKDVKESNPPFTGKVKRALNDML